MTYLPNDNFSIKDDSNCNALVGQLGYIKVGQFTEEISIGSKNSNISFGLDWQQFPSDSNRSYTVTDNVLTISSTNSQPFDAISRDTAVIPAGYEAITYFSVAFDTPQNNVIKIAELFNDRSMVGIGYNGTVFSIFYARDLNNPVSIIPSTSFVGNLSSSGQNIDPTKFNKYLIKFSSSGDIVFCFFQPNYGWITLHHIITNTLTNTELLKRSFKFGLSLSGSTSGSTMRFESVSAGFYGEKNPFIRKNFSYISPIRTWGTANVPFPILSIRPNNTLNNSPIYGRIVVDTIQIFNTGSQNTAISAQFYSSLTGAVWINPVSQSLTPYWSNIWASVDVSSTAVSLTTALPIFSFYSMFGNGANSFINSGVLKMPKFSLYPSEIISFTGVIPSNSGSVSICINCYIED